MILLLPACDAATVFHLPLPVSYRLYHGCLLYAHCIWLASTANAHACLAALPAATLDRLGSSISTGAWALNELLCVTLLFLITRIPNAYLLILYLRILATSAPASPS